MSVFSIAVKCFTTAGLTAFARLACLDVGLKEICAPDPCEFCTEQKRVCVRVKQDLPKSLQFQEHAQQLSPCGIQHPLLRSGDQCCPGCGHGHVIWCSKLRLSETVRSIFQLMSWPERSCYQNVNLKLFLKHLFCWGLELNFRMQNALFPDSPLVSYCTLCAGSCVYLAFPCSPLASQQP